MYGDVPEAFGQVVLKDKRTWPRATLREWMDLRYQLLDKKEEQKKLHDLESERIKVHFAANKHIKDEIRRRGPSARLSEKAKEQLHRRFMTAHFYKKHPEFSPLTEWEREFLDTSTWIDKAYEAYLRRPTYPEPTSILFEWLIEVEDCYEIAKRREEERDKAARSVQTKSRKSHRRVNAYYPRPIELIFIYKCAMTVMHNVQDQFQTYVVFGEPADDSISANKFEIRDFLRGRNHKDKVLRFLHQLKSYGYIPYREEEDCLRWDHWEVAITKDTPTIATTDFLSFLFKVRPTTISRDLGRGVLKSMYDQHGVVEAYRLYRDGSGDVDTARLYRQGWYLRLENGKPSRFDSGVTYYPMYSVDIARQQLE